jgi:hypothetical protein
MQGKKMGVEGNLLMILCVNTPHTTVVLCRIYRGLGNKRLRLLWESRKVCRKGTLRQTPGEFTRARVDKGTEGRAGW